MYILGSYKSPLSKELYALRAGSSTETSIKFDQQDGPIKNVYLFITRDLFSRGLVIPFNGFSFIDTYRFQRCHLPHM